MKKTGLETETEWWAQDETHAAKLKNIVSKLKRINSKVNITVKIQGQDKGWDDLNALFVISEGILPPKGANSIKLLDLLPPMERTSLNIIDRVARAIMAAA